MVTGAAVHLLHLVAAGGKLPALHLANAMTHDPQPPAAEKTLDLHHPGEGLNTHVRHLRVAQMNLSAALHHLPPLGVDHLHPRVPATNAVETGDMMLRAVTLLLRRVAIAIVRMVAKQGTPLETEIGIWSGISAHLQSPLGQDAQGRGLHHLIWLGADIGLCRRRLGENQGVHREIVRIITTKTKEEKGRWEGAVIGTGREEGRPRITGEMIGTAVLWIGRETGDMNGADDRICVRILGESTVTFNHVVFN